MWLSTDSRSGGVHAARKARPMTDCEIGTEVPMSGRVVMPLPQAVTVQLLSQPSPFS